MSFLERALPSPPEIFLVLGSGLAAVADDLGERVELAFEDVPGLPGAGVAGHPGRFVAGRLAGRSLLAQVGRFHLYEGHAPAVVTAPVRLAAALGARVAILTNSSGAIDPRLRPGDVALIEDHLDLQWAPPTLPGTAARRSRQSSEGDDRGSVFDRKLAAITHDAARDLGIALVGAVYTAVRGPSYETPAEIRMLQAAGAGLVGMSTVPEAGAAARSGMRVLGLSLVTNRAAGLAPGALAHRDVLRAGARGAPVISRLIPAVIQELGR